MATLFFSSEVYFVIFEAQDVYLQSETDSHRLLSN
jgi:hypothetical protein